MMGCSLVYIALLDIIETYRDSKLIEILNSKSLPTTMANNLEVHATRRIAYKRCVVARMVLCSKTRRAVASSARLQSRGVELFDLVDVCVADLSGVVWWEEKLGNTAWKQESLKEKNGSWTNGGRIWETHSRQ